MNTRQPIYNQDLQYLISQGASPCVSIYMPTPVAGPETQQNPIRLKNLITVAQDRLTDRGMGIRDAEELLGSLHQQVTAGGLFRERQQPGLAVFVCPGFERIFQLPLRFDELVVTGDRFHVKPLLPLLSGDGHFFVLAISQNEIRLLRGTRDTVTEVELENVSSGLADVLKSDVTERRVQHRLVGRHIAASSPAIFHGHGGTKEAAQSDLLRYFQKVDTGLKTILREERAPLVLAGVDYMRSAYAQVSEYPGLVEDGLTGNPDMANPAELHQAAWEVVRPHFARVREGAAGRYRELAQTDRASDAVKTIVPAAFHGGVETLFVAVDRQLWGAFDPERNAVEIHTGKGPGDEDLLDFAAIHTLLNGGEVFAGEDVPGGGEACAVFRYTTGGIP